MAGYSHTVRLNSSLGKVSEPRNLFSHSLHLWDEKKSHCEQKLGSDMDEVVSIDLSITDHDAGHTDSLLTEWVPVIRGLRDLADASGLCATLHGDDTALCPRVALYFVQTTISLELQPLFGLVNASNSVQNPLNIINEHVLYFAMHVKRIGGNNEEVRSVIIEVFAVYVSLFVKLIMFIRSYQSIKRAKAAWDHYAEPHISDAFKTIDRQKQQVKEISETFQISDLSMKTGSTSIVDSWELSTSETTLSMSPKYHHLPNPKIADFFGRQEQIEYLKNTLDRDPKNVRHRTACICGPGGIGKTQLALEYAHSQKQQLNLIFWIDSDSQMSIDKSFSDIALLLGLAETEEGGNQANNKFLVSKWLQKCNDDFLMIFDNVENVQDILDHCWPVSEHASLLVTARPEIVTADMIKCIEVPSFSDIESLEFLLKIISKSNHSESDLDAAKKLSESLGGIPLAVTIMAMDIRSSKMSLTKFLRLYERYSAKVHQRIQQGKVSLQPYYPHTLHDCYGSSFQRLKEADRDAYELFKIVCMLGAEDLPSTLFCSESAELPEPLAFCEDEFSFGDAVRSLTDRALVKVTTDPNDVDATWIFAHRVIQVEFNTTQLDLELRENFLAAGGLLFDMFPKLVNGLSFRKVWADCAKLAGHVSALCKHYNPKWYNGDDSVRFENIVQCLASCAWYLRETSNFAGSKTILDVAFKMCVNTNSLLYANLLNTAGVIATRQNNIIEGYKYHRECLEIRQELLDKDHEEIANSHNNIGNTYLSDCRYDDAIHEYLEAIRIDKLQPEEEARKILNIRYSNIAEAYMMKGEYLQMEEYIRKSRKLAIEEFGEGTFYDTDVDWILGHKHYHDRNLHEARRLYTRAYNVNRVESASSMMTNAILYKLGSISLEMGDTEAAIVQLREALELAHVNAKVQGNKGEVARVKRRLADALRKVKGFEEEAERLHQEAEKTRYEIQSDRLGKLSDSEHSYDLLLACYYRGWHLGA